MRGAHVCAAPGGPLRRSGRGARGLGWWQPPTRSAPTGRRRRVPDERAPQHRRPEPPAARAPARPPSRARRLRRGLLLGAAVLVLGPVSAFAPGFLLIGVPAPEDVVRGSAALISYADGSELARLAVPAADRPRVRLDRLPGPVRDAVLAARDPDFGSRPLADPTALLRAVSGPDRGTAPDPVPDQFVDRALAGFAPTPWRSYREVVLVSKLAAQGDRDQVLADYLDSVYLGRGGYGLAGGARDYFGKDVADLGLEEGALLAALISEPTVDPALDPARAEQGWTRVLDAMVTRGWLSADRRAAARFPAVLPRRPGTGLPDDERGPAVAAVLAELGALGYAEPQLALGGLRVTTTLDPARQARAAVAAEQAGAGAGTAVGIVAVDPATGGVLAYRGGPDAAGPDAARVRLPVGAALAPVVLVAGRLQDPPVGPADCPGCPNGGLAGLVGRIGPQAVAATAVAAGIGGPPGEPAPVDPTATAVDPVELASAYATLAAGGVRRPAHLVASVSTADGRVLYRAPGGGERRLPEAATRAVALGDPTDGPWAAGVAGGVAAVVRVAAGGPVGIAARGPAAATVPDPAGAARRAWADLVAG